MNQQEPDIIYPVSIPFRTYDLNLWSGDNNILNLTAYPILLNKTYPDEVEGTDYDSGFYSWSFQLDNAVDYSVIDWLLCSYLSLVDWSDIDGLDEWNTFYGNIEGLEAECFGEKTPMPDRLKKWLNELPAYEPRKVQG